MADDSPTGARSMVDLVADLLLIVMTDHDLGDPDQHLAYDEADLLRTVNEAGRAWENETAWALIEGHCSDIKNHGPHIWVSHPLTDRTPRKCRGRFSGAWSPTSASFQPGDPDTYPLRDIAERLDDLGEQEAADHLRCLADRMDDAEVCEGCCSVCGGAGEIGREVVLPGGSVGEVGVPCGACGGSGGPS